MPGDVDLSKIKPGDEVTVRGLVREGPYSTSIGMVCRLNIGPGSLVVLAIHIVSHHPKALSVGDRVTVVGADGARATIRHIIDDYAWVRWDPPTSGPDQEVRLLAILERV